MKLVLLSHRVEGSVVDQAGKPVIGAEVVASGFSEPGRDGVSVPSLDGQVPVPRAVMDQAGQFIILLPAGTGSVLEARHPRFFGPGIGVSDDAKVLAPLIVEPAGAIAGRVVDAATGRPVPAAVVRAQLTEYRQRILGGLGQARADGRGHFAITGLEPGVYNLLFEKAPGRPRATARAVEGLRACGTEHGRAHEGHGRSAAPRRRDRRRHREARRRQPRRPLRPARPQSGAAVSVNRTDADGGFIFHVPPGENYVYLMNVFSNRRSSRRTLAVPEEGEAEFVRLDGPGRSDRRQWS